MRGFQVYGWGGFLVTIMGMRNGRSQAQECSPYDLLSQDTCFYDTNIDELTPSTPDITIRRSTNVLCSYPAYLPNSLATSIDGTPFIPYIVALPTLNTQGRCFNAVIDSAYLYEARLQLVHYYYSNDACSQDSLEYVVFDDRELDLTSRYLNMAWYDSASQYNGTNWFLMVLTQGQLSFELVISGRCPRTATPVASPAACVDWNCFCASKDTSMGDRPCLPRLDDELGYGFDIVTGETTQRVVRLLHEAPKIFRHTILGDFDIPGNVECQELTVRSETIFTSLFQSTVEYRKYLATQSGVTVGSQVGFSGSADYRRAKSEYFQQSRYLSESTLDEPLYRCSLIYTSEPELVQTTQSIVDLGEDVVKRLGTHIVTTATFGGQASLRGSIDACVFITSSDSSVGASIGLNFWDLIGLQVSSESGSETSCSAVFENTSFDRTIRGGDPSLLSRRYSSASSWYSSIALNPAPIKRNIRDIYSIVPGVSSFDVDLFLEMFDDPNDVKVNVEGGSPCEDACSLAVRGTGMGGLRMEGVVVLFVAILNL